MVKKILLILFLSLFFSSINTSAQAWLWGTQPSPEHPNGFFWGDPLGDHCVATDANGNAYETTASYGRLVFGTDTTNLAAAYLAKYDPNGNFLWVRTLLNAWGISVSTDPSNNVYDAGTFTDTLIAGPDTLLCNNSSLDDVFLIKYDANGNVLWARQAISKKHTKLSVLVNVKGDISGNVYLTGVFTDTLIFGTDTLISGGSTPINYNIFLVKYDANGNLLWATQSTGTNSTPIYYNDLSITSDAYSNAYITGSFTNTITFGNHTLNDPSAINGDLFLVKYTPGGHAIWATQTTGATNTDNESNSVAIDGAGNPYITGDFAGSLTFNNTTLITTHPNTYDILLTKYDTGGHVIWAIGGGQINNNSWSSYALACDTQKRGGGYLLISGTGNSPLKIKFGSDTLGLNISPEITILFRFDSSGKVNCINSFNEGGEDDGDGLAVDPTGQYIYVGGDIVNTVIIGPDTLRYGGNDFPYAARWLPCCVNPLTVFLADTFICLGNNITLTASGAINYTWTPPTGLNITTGSSVIATPTTDISYIVKGTTNGCAGFDTVNIKVKPAPPHVIIPPTDSVYFCGNSASAKGVVSGGALPYTYLWNPSGETVDSATGLHTGIYTLTVKDSNQCTATANAFIGTERGGAIIDANTSAPKICQGTSVTLSAITTNVTSPIIWKPITDTGATVTLTPTVTTTYTVTGMNSCDTANATVTISVNTIPSPAFNSDITTGCSPLCIQFYNSSSISSGRISSFNWKFSQGSSLAGNRDSSASQNPIYCYPTPGIYSVKITATSDSGCSATLTKDNYITVYTNPVAGFTSSPQPTTILQPTIQFTDKSTDAYGISEWNWSFGDTSDSNSKSQNTSHTYHDTGTYCAHLAVMNIHGCTDTVTNCLVIDPIFALYIPSAFSPNGDSKNELFEAKGNDIKSFEMYIFDRWGTELFHSIDINTGWNGTFKKYYLPGRCVYICD